MPRSKKSYALTIGAIVLLFIVVKDLTLPNHGVLLQNPHLWETLNKIRMEQRVTFFKSPEAIDGEIAAQLQLKEENNMTKKTEFNVREWLDSRPDVQASERSSADHPFFHGFEIENFRVCQSRPVDLLIYVQSAADHADRRSAIRNTWGSRKLFYNISVEIVFVLGLTRDPDYQLDVEMEQGAFGDLIQGKFNDTFNDLTYKAITALVWINKHCPQAKLIMKVDDDFFVDTYRVMEELVPLLDRKNKSIVCDHITNYNISRDPKNKWYVHPKYLPDAKKWPPFCSGYFTLMSGDLVPFLYERSFQPEKFVPIDDAFIFGILTDGLSGVKVTNVHDKISVFERPDPSEELKTNGKLEYVVFAITPKKARNLWDLKSKMLNEWERELSLFHRIFHDGVKSVVIL